MPSFTKTGRVSIKTPSGTRCGNGFRRGGSKKAGPSDKGNCVERRPTGQKRPKRNVQTGKFVPASTPVGPMIEEI